MTTWHNSPRATQLGKLHWKRAISFYLAIAKYNNLVGYLILFDIVQKLRIILHSKFNKTKTICQSYQHWNQESYTPFAKTKT